MWQAYRQPLSRAPAGAESPPPSLAPILLSPPLLPFPFGTAPRSQFYIVNGAKKWITNGTFCDYFVTGELFELFHCHLALQAHGLSSALIALLNYQPARQRKGSACFSLSDRMG